MCLSLDKSKKSLQIGSYMNKEEIVRQTSWQKSKVSLAPMAASSWLSLTSKLTINTVFNKTWSLLWRSAQCKIKWRNRIKSCSTLSILQLDQSKRSKKQTRALSPSTTISNTFSSNVITTSNMPSAAFSCHLWGANFTLAFLLSIGRIPFRL